MTCYKFECSHWCKIYLKNKPLQDFLSSLNAVISTNESTKFITGHLIYNPAYTYKFQLKTTQVILPMVALAAVAIKILVKSGKDMRREMWGVSVQQITNKPQKKPENLVEKLENVSTGSGEDSEFSWGGFFKGQDVSN